jgi:hypothetical protein
MDGPRLNDRLYRIGNDRFSASKVRDVRVASVPVRYLCIAGRPKAQVERRLHGHLGSGASRNGDVRLSRRIPTVRVLRQARLVEHDSQFRQAHAGTPVIQSRRPRVAGAPEVSRKLDNARALVC